MTPADQNALTFIRSIQAGQLNGVSAADCGPWRDVIFEAARAFEQAGPEAALRIINREPGLMRLANEDDDPQQKLVEVYAGDDALLMPELPGYARPTPEQENEARACAAWLNIYVEYAYRRAPMLPRNFHESAGLWLLSLSVARRLKVPMPHSDVFPNLFILWVAPTTIYSKSTALNIARELAEAAVPHLLLSNEFSPEGLLDDMAGKPPQNLMELPLNHQQAWEQSRKFSSRRGLILDEASSLFASMKREYNTGLAEAIMRFYDCGSHRGRTRGRGMAIVRDSYLCFIGATTETGLRQAEHEKLWLSGLWPRFGLLVPTEKPVYKRFVETPQQPGLLVTHLQNIASEWLPVPADVSEYPAPHSVTLGPGVFDAWQSYDRAIFSILLDDNPPGEHLSGIYGRLPTQALKIAVCLAAADWNGDGGSPVVSLPHYVRAQLICEQWRASAHQLYYNLTGMAEADSFEHRLLNYIARAEKEGLTTRELYKLLRSTREKVEAAIFALEKDGLVSRFRPARAKADHFCLPAYQVDLVNVGGK